MLRAALISSSFFLHAKIAGARKSSPAKGKEKGCSCEGDLAHIKYLSRNEWNYYNPVFYKMQPLFYRVKVPKKTHTAILGGGGEFVCGKLKTARPIGRTVLYGAGDEARTRFRTPSKLRFAGDPAPRIEKNRGHTAILGGGSEFVVEN